MAAAMGSGMAAIIRPSGRMAPVARISVAARRNAPTPCAMLRPVLPAISAAPGVDQASTTGLRVQKLRPAEPAALARLMARTQESVSSGLAPSAAAAARTSAMVPP